MTRQYAELSTQLSVNFQGNSDQKNDSSNLHNADGVIHYLNYDYNEVNGNFSDFDLLLEETENDEEFSESLKESRKWISSSYYNDDLTLTSLRLSLGLSQKELGEICGFKQSHISRYESGRSIPSIETSAKLAQALNVNLCVFHEAWKNTKVYSGEQDDI
jgi:DNA-binding XRE family transcriptional regulator